MSRQGEQPARDQGDSERRATLEALVDQALPRARARWSSFLLLSRPVIEEGHLVPLDDPHVREVAERYGDPDELLREDWIPDRNTAI